MDKDLKLNDEPVEEQSPDLSKSANGDNPVREDGAYSIRDQMSKGDKKQYPMPDTDDKRHNQQDEYDAVDKKNRQ